MLEPPGGGLLIVDADLRVLLIDGNAHLDPGLVGRRAPDVFRGEAWTTLEPRYRGALDGEAESSYQNMVGEPPVQRLRMAPIRDGGAVVGVMVLSGDAVAGVTNGNSLPEGEYHQQSVLDLLEEGVIVLDAQGRLLQANNAAGVILGFDPEADLAAGGIPGRSRPGYLGHRPADGQCDPGLRGRDGTPRRYEADPAGQLQRPAGPRRCDQRVGPVAPRRNRAGTRTSTARGNAGPTAGSARGRAAVELGMGPGHKRGVRLSRAAWREVCTGDEGNARRSLGRDPTRRAPGSARRPPVDGARRERGIGQAKSPGIRDGARVARDTDAGGPRREGEAAVREGHHRRM